MTRARARKKVARKRRLATVKPRKLAPKKPAREKPVKRRVVKGRRKSRTPVKVKAKARKPHAPVKVKSKARKSRTPVKVKAKARKPPAPAKAKPSKTRVQKQPARTRPKPLARKPAPAAERKPTKVKRKRESKKVRELQAELERARRRIDAVESARKARRKLRHEVVLAKDRARAAFRPMVAAFRSNAGPDDWAEARKPWHAAKGMLWELIPDSDEFYDYMDALADEFEVEWILSYGPGGEQ